MFSRNRHRGPVAEPAAGFEWGFENSFAWEISLGGAPKFDSQQERPECPAVGLPLNVEAHAGNLIRVLAEKRLVSIAIVKARRGCVAALQIEEVW